MTRVVICQDDARNTTGCGNGHLQDGDGEAIRSDCQARMATGHPNGMGRGNSKGKDRVKDCREHGSSGTGRDDLRGRHTPSPFLYMHTCNPVIWPHTSSSPLPRGRYLSSIIRMQATSIAPASLDTFEPFEILLFTLYWREPIIGTVPTLGVVKHFNVIEHILPGLLVIRIGFTSEPLAPEELKETLRHRVIMQFPRRLMLALSRCSRKKSCQS